MRSWRKTLGIICNGLFPKQEVHAIILYLKYFIIIYFQNRFSSSYASTLISTSRYISLSRIQLKNPLRLVRSDFVFLKMHGNHDHQPSILGPSRVGHAIGEQYNSGASAIKAMLLFLHLGGEYMGVCFMSTML